jgi:hypothetical protein
MIFITRYGVQGPFLWRKPVFCIQVLNQAIIKAQVERMQSHYLKAEMTIKTSAHVRLVGYFRYVFMII